MKRLTRLALALAVATLACLAPMSYADDQYTDSPVIDCFPRHEFSYDYHDEDGDGTLVVQDGTRFDWGRSISVTLYQNGYTFYGEGKRKYANPETGYLAACEFWLSDGSASGKFTGYIPILEGYSGYGNYWYNGAGSPHHWSVDY